MSDPALATETSNMRSPGRTPARRGVIVVVDQVINSISTFSLTILVARQVGAEDFAALAVALALYSLVVAFSQALVGKVVSVRLVHESFAGQELNQAAATALALGAACGAVIATGAVAFDLSSRLSLVILAAALPWMLLQDFWRTSFIAIGKPGSALANDVVWLAAQSVVLGGLLVIDVTNVAAFVLAWGAAAVLSATYGYVQAGTSLTVKGLTPFIRRHRRLAQPSVAHAMLTVGAMQAALLAVAVRSSPRDVGALRADQTLLGPLNVLAAALNSFLIPELSRRPRGRSSLVRTAFAASLALAMAYGLWTLLLLLMSDSAGRHVLGATWPSARSSIAPMGCYSICLALCVGPSAVLWSRAQATSLMRINMLLGPTMVLAALIGAGVDGAPGAAWALAGSAMVFVPVHWATMWRKLGRVSQAPSVDSSG